MLNSIRSINYLLYLIVFTLFGCSEKATRHVYINEPPSSIEQQTHVATQEIKPEAKQETVDNPPVIKTASLKIKHKEIQKKIQEKIKKETQTVWKRLFSLYALPKINNPRIERELKNYLKYPKYLTKIQQRAEPYLYFILDEIEAKGIPGEIALLPAIESSFKPHAISKSGALGLWQFMPATGRLFGLQQNNWYDGRKDIYKSTQAATTYLQELAELHNGDWSLALASYNAGKGTIGKAIKRNKKRKLATDYWSLSLTEEPTNYVPKLLAIAKIFKNAQFYNLPSLKTPNVPYFSMVNVQSPMDLKIMAKMAKTSLADFRLLNPAFKKSNISSKGHYHLLIHTLKAEKFKNTLASTPNKNWVKKYFQHQIKTGENLNTIANIYNTSVTAIRQNNNLLSTTIKTGQFLLIPNSVKNNTQTYIVKNNDTF